MTYTYITAAWNLDLHRFVEEERFADKQEWIDELGGYADTLDPSQHNHNEKELPLKDRILWTTAETIDKETAVHLLFRNHHEENQRPTEQVYQADDGASATFIPNWFEREHIESMIGFEFNLDADYDEFLFTYKQRYGDEIASLVSEMVKETMTNHKLSEGYTLSLIE